MKWLEYYAEGCSVLNKDFGTNNFPIYLENLQLTEGFSVPSAAPSTGVFIGESPLGASQGSGALYVGEESPLGKNLINTLRVQERGERRNYADAGCLFFGQAKKGASLVGATNR